MNSPDPTGIQNGCEDLTIPSVTMAKEVILL